MKTLVDRAIEAVARARAPKEPPRPAGPEIDGMPVLERPVCPLCGNTRARPVVIAEDTWNHGTAARLVDRYAVVRCEICAHRYTTPRFRREHRHLAYDGDYPFYQRAKDFEGELSKEDRAAARRPFLNRAAHLSNVAHRPGRILDIGCGDGFFLDVMRSRGWQTVGVDIDPDVVRFAKDVVHVDARVLDAEIEDLPEGPFDAVTMWGMLQLVYEPRPLLERIRSVLEPGGIVGVGVSNFRSAGASLFQGRWRGLGVPRHVSHFTPRTLTRLFEWSGFEVVRTDFETPRWIVAGSVDDSVPLPRVARAAVKAPFYALSGVLGRTSVGDTLEMYARGGFK